MVRSGQYLVGALMVSIEEVLLVHNELGVSKLGGLSPKLEVEAIVIEKMWVCIWMKLMVDYLVVLGEMIVCVVLIVAVQTH
jgi:hypothetical protein